MSRAIVNDQEFPSIRVAVGVLFNDERKVLIAKRPDHLRGGGFWEFPGGKIELHENPRVALVRELKEEIDVSVVDAKPLLHFSYRYPEREVALYAWHVISFEGSPRGAEGQTIQWVFPSDLYEVQMLPANHGIVQAIQTIELANQ